MWWWQSGCVKLVNPFTQVWPIWAVVLTCCKIDRWALLHWEGNEPIISQSTQASLPLTWLFGSVLSLPLSETSSTGVAIGCYHCQLFPFLKSFRRHCFPCLIRENAPAVYLLSYLYIPICLLPESGAPVGISWEWSVFLDGRYPWWKEQQNP